jgi:hypothetical protein
MTGPARAISADTRRSATARLSVALAAVGAIALTACGSDDKKSSSGAASSKPASLTITASTFGAKGAEYAIPAGVKSGVVTVTLRNTTKFPREAQLLRVEGKHSTAEVKRVVDSDDAPVPSWMHAAGGVADVPPKASKKATVELAPGNYLVIDTSDPDSPFIPAKFGHFEVAAGDSQAKFPTAPAQITAREYAFAASNLKAGTSEVLFRNTGKEVHHAILFPMNAGATIADVTKFFKTDGKAGGPPPVDFKKGVGTITALDGGSEQVVELTLKSGRYAAVCFFTDRAGGPPHFLKGQLTELTVE